MEYRTFCPGTVFTDHTYYTFEAPTGDIYREQTVPATEKKYFSLYAGKNELTCLDTAFLLRDLHDVTLDFGGAVITLHGKIQPFLIDRCTNLTIRNVTVEYARSPFTEFDIVGRSGRELRVRPKPKFPCRVEDGYFVPYAKEWENTRVHATGCHFLQAFDRETREGDGFTVVYLGEEIVEEDTPPAPNIAHIRVRREGEDILLIGELPEHWSVRDSLVLEHESRTFSSVAMYHSEGVTLENYRILNGGGMGFLAIRTKDITIQKARLEQDERSHGIVTNSADGIHFVACSGRIDICDSVFEGMIDDALNIHANFYQVSRSEGNRIVAVRSRASHALDAYTGVFAPGDEIVVYRGSTLEERKRYTVQGVRVVGDWSVELTVDRQTGGTCPDDLIENLTTNADIHIRNSRFGKANTHLRLQSRGTICIEDCDFSLPILLTGDTTYWFESDPVTDLTVRNCRFCGQRAGIRVVPDFIATEAAPFYHGGICVTDCRFESDVPLEAHCTIGIRLFGNTYCANPRFVTDRCAGVCIES